MKRIRQWAAWVLIGILWALSSRAHAQEVWHVPFVNTFVSGIYANPSAVATDSHGNIYVTGFIALDTLDSSSDADYLTVKFDPDGNVVWTRRYNGLASGADYVAAIAVDDQDNVYVTGTSGGDPLLLQAPACVTIKYTSDGVALWVQRLEAIRGVYARTLLVDKDGNVYLAAYTGDGIHEGDWLVAKYDTNGSLLWTQHYSIPDAPSIPSALAIDAQGNLYATGSIGSYGTEHATTIKYDPEGTPLWVQIYNQGKAGDSGASDLAVDQNGNVFVVGGVITKPIGTGGITDYLTIKYDSEGNELWTHTYDGLSHSYDGASHVVVDEQGNPTV